MEGTHGWALNDDAEIDIVTVVEADDAASVDVA